MQKKKPSGFLLIPILLFTLQSCFVAKEYQRPEVVQEENFRTSDLPADTASMADVSWREIFTDPILASHIDKALENNIDIRIALTQIEAAEAYFKQGKAAYFPTFNGRGQVNHQKFSGNSQFGTLFNGWLTQYELSGTLSWEADIWGKIRSTRRASEASYLQSIAAHQAVKSALISNLATLYFQLLTLDEQKKITEETIANMENSLETTIALKDAGMVTGAGVKQTEAQVYSAKALLIDLELNIHLLENTFSILLGEAPREIERSTLEEQEITTELKSGVPLQLLRNRPDIIAAEYNLINAFELTNIAKSNFYPSLSLVGTGGFQSLEIDKLLSVNSLFASMIGSLTQPIFNGRQIRTQYEVSLSQQEQAYLNFRYALLDASREVSDALYSFEAAEEKIEMRKLEFEANDTATIYAEELLNSGFANYLEVLTARGNALNSELNLTNAKFTKLNAVVDLYRALGGGWR